MEMEIDESFSHNQSEENQNVTTNNKNVNNRLLGQGHNQTNEESCLELSGKLFLEEPTFDDQNNNCYERYICSKCNTPKPSARLLDIHIQEDHVNVFFKLLSEKQPMYECYLERCDLKFNSSRERDEHSISVHKYAKSSGTFVDRSQFTKWKSINHEPCMAEKRRNMDDFESNKRTAFDSDFISPQINMTKSTLAFVPRQILLENYPKISVSCKK